MFVNDKRGAFGVRDIPTLKWGEALRWPRHSRVIRAFGKPTGEQETTGDRVYVWSGKLSPHGKSVNIDS